MTDKVAIIDDDKDYAFVLSRALEKFEMELTAFSSPSDFFEAKGLDYNIFDCVLVDLDLPDVSGITWDFAGMTIVKTVRDVVRSDCVVGIHSGFDKRSVLASAKRHGADVFLTKQSDMSKVCEIIAGHIRNRRAQGL